MVGKVLSEASRAGPSDLSQVPAFPRASTTTLASKPATLRGHSTSQVQKLRQGHLEIGREVPQHKSPGRIQPQGTGLRARAGASRMSIETRSHSLHHGCEPAIPNQVFDKDLKEPWPAAPPGSGAWPPLMQPSWSKLQPTHSLLAGPGRSSYPSPVRRLGDTHSKLSRFLTVLKLETVLFSYLSAVFYRSFVPGGLKLKELCTLSSLSQSQGLNNCHILSPACPDLPSPDHRV